MNGSENLKDQAAIKGSMLKAHLAWAKQEIADLNRLKPHLDLQTNALLEHAILVTDWVPLRCLIQIDRAIATVIGGRANRVYNELGKYSAFINLNGVYKKFMYDEPHRFFDRMSILHDQYQNFGRINYEKVGARAGRATIDHYDEFSPVYCASATGYFEEALKLMKAPGPIIVVEKRCQCWGSLQCVFEIAW